ncbi:hypothetical protein L484_026856 [Morus notabilis]|uniref:CCHC-type domain-containing protein n=1 Tax=Morus notabilis TaxID=981085 RepID=W9RGL3_9ROSA|nr:hypothetical protein L484_026856 [Morus notabilis]
MNKKKSNLTELMNDLQNFESTNKRRGGKVNVVVAGSSGKIKRKNQNQGKGKKGKKKRPKNAKGPIQKPKGKCFHCNGEGRRKRNCHKYLEELKKKKEQGKSNLLVLETCLVEGDTSAWIIDSGATNHVCFSLQSVSSYTKLADGDYTMKVGNVARVSAKAVREDGPLRELKIGELSVCESCLEGKMTKRPFTAKGERATDPFS